MVESDMAVCGPEEEAQLRDIERSNRDSLSDYGILLDLREHAAKCLREDVSTIPKCGRCHGATRCLHNRCMCVECLFSRHTDNDHLDVFYTFKSTCDCCFFVPRLCRCRHDARCQCDDPLKRTCRACVKADRDKHRAVVKEEMEGQRALNSLVGFDRLLPRYLVRNIAGFLGSREIQRIMPAEVDGAW